MYIDYDEGLDFDDVLIEPIPSEINSRNQVDLSVDLGVVKLSFPIIASPMKGIMSLNMAVALSRLGGIGILHRFYDDQQKWLDEITYLNFYNCNYGVAIGLNDDRYKDALNYGAKIVCIDVANGYTESLVSFASVVSDYITKKGYSALLMAGNVASAVGARNLIDNGVNLIRTGIGSGQLCTTRNATGVGVPQLTAISRVDQVTYVYTREMYDFNILNNTVTFSGVPHEVTKREKKPNVYIVADGGIRNSGDAVKAIVVGADVVMLGSLLGKTFESSHNGIIYGMASRKLQEEYYHGVKSVEGLEKEMEQVQSVGSFIEEFTWNMKSACTYVNASNIADLRSNSRFIRVGRGSIK